MKKFYTAIALMFVVATALAQGVTTHDLQSAAMSNNAVSRMSAEIPQLRVVDAAGKKVVKRMLKAAETTLPTKDDIISVQPEGTLYKNMYRRANVYLASTGASTNRVYDGYVGDIVVSKDGKKLYMKDPYLKFAPKTWIVGDLGEDGIVEFKFPQAIYYQGGDDEFTGYAWKMTITSESIAPDETTQSVKFKWTGSSLTQVNDDDIIGLTNENGEWMGYGALENSFTTLTDAANKPVDLSNAQGCRMTYLETNGNTATASLQMVIDGNDMYIGGIYNPDFWIKGTISGDKVTFPAQYLGVNKSTTHAYMMPYDISSYQAMQTLEFSYDAENGILTNEQAIEINIGKNNMSSLGMYLCPKIEKTDYAVDTPANPEVAQVYAYGFDPAEPEVAAIIYNLSNLSATGKQLNEDNIYYNLYLDDELQTFYKSEYTYIAADMTDIPYAYTDSYSNWFNGEKGWDFKVGNQQQFVYIYKPFSRIGLQAIYVDGENRYASQVVDYELTDGINDAIVDNGAEKSVSYCDVSGRKLSAPAKGISLKTITYANGKTKTVKVLK